MIVGISDLERNLFGGQAYFVNGYFEEDGKMNPQLGFLVLRKALITPPRLFGAIIDSRGIARKVSGNFEKNNGRMGIKFGYEKGNEMLKYDVEKENNSRRIEGKYRGQWSRFVDGMYRGRGKFIITLDRIEENPE